VRHRFHGSEKFGSRSISTGAAFREGKQQKAFAVLHNVEDLEVYQESLCHFLSLVFLLPYKRTKHIFQAFYGKNLIYKGDLKRVAEVTKKILQ